MTPLELLELTIEDKVKGIWFGEKYNSEFKRWYSNGQLWIHISYKDDRLDGEYKCWHENGQLNVHCSYKDGELDGAMLHKLMCIFFRPIKYKAGKHYEIDKYDSDKTSRYADQLLQLDMEQVVNTLLFFSTLESELYNTSLSYLAKEMEAMMMEATQLHQTA